MGAHVRGRARRHAGRGRWRMHFRRHDQHVPEQDGRWLKRPRRSHRPRLQGLRGQGKIEAEMFRHALMNFGDKFSQAEVDDIFGEFEVDDDGFVESKAVIGLFVAGGGEEKKEEKKEEEAPAAPAEAEAAPEDGGAKKKKKKKKAAK